MGTADRTPARDLNKLTNHDRNEVINEQKESAPRTERPLVVREESLDDFGLAKTKPTRPRTPIQHSDGEDDEDTFHDAPASVEASPVRKRADSTKPNGGPKRDTVGSAEKETDKTDSSTMKETESTQRRISKLSPRGIDDTRTEDGAELDNTSRKPDAKEGLTDPAEASASTAAATTTNHVKTTSMSSAAGGLASMPIRKEKVSSGPAVSDWSHQKLAPKDEGGKVEEEEEEEQWQAMPAIDEFDVFDDEGRLVAKGVKVEEVDDKQGYYQPARKGYTRVQLDEDAQSTNSMEENTDYLFRGHQPEKKIDDDEDAETEEQRDSSQQLQATKDLLTEGQRIAYVGVVRLVIYKMLAALEVLDKTKGTKTELNRACENMEIWGQKMMLRLYAHMEIDSAEQLMIEQLAEHGVQPGDLATPLMHNAKIKNPMADEKELKTKTSENSSDRSSRSSSVSDHGEVPDVHGPEDMPRTKQIELDIRWTVLCDLFLLVVGDGVYDARSRRLLERVASTMQITWVQICRFEKRIVDAIEMQEDEMKEQHDESENMEKRRKMGLRRKYVFMGLATVGGGLVIGLSAGLLAPLIGAGFAAGFTTLGVTGTAGFFAGAGGAALITSAATVTGGTIAVRASDRRTGHVKTFEYRPLHNNKRPNLVLTVSGWMTGKVDDVRLPFSTIDPIMGDIYSLLWEPEMLRSMGDTINILATEALTQTVQQVLGSTILVALMASIQLPVVLTKLSYLIDNPWSVSLDRAHSAGLILADSLIDRHLGQRPITLLGFSLGARVIFSCLKELSVKGAYGIIQNVYLFGSPVVAKKDDYLKARSVISGRFVNGYASNDWILGYLFRATSGGIMRVAGLAPVDNVPGLENIDVSKIVNGHMAYRSAMPKLLREVGWEIESDEFTEIEDPDPEDHAARQRELIREIDEARKKAEEKPEKKRFGLFKRGKLAEKKGWETYDPKSGNKQIVSGGDGSKEGAAPGLDANVLFDIEAIRKELAGEMIEVREIDSTLPPLQITSVKNGEKHIEYLRLPPGMTAEEVKRMNLPPRPEDIDVGPALPPKDKTAESKRWSMAFGGSKNTTPVLNPTPKFEQYTYEEPKEIQSTLPPLAITPGQTPKDFDRRGSSPIHGTPPLRGTPPTRPTLHSYASAADGFERRDSSSPHLGPNSRPPMQTFTSTPAVMSARKDSWARSRDVSPAPPSNRREQPENTNKLAAMSTPAVAPPYTAMSLEHNAWADEHDGEVKLTFE